jgi:hypothetical protein
LAKRVVELHPDICVIFMSGYSEEALDGKPIPVPEKHDLDSKGV